MNTEAYPVLYFAAINLLAVMLTAYDKNAAKKRKRRISEKSLLLTAAIGGAVGMYTTMIVIRHKTKHKKFMISLPIMIVLHLAVIVVSGYM